MPTFGVAWLSAALVVVILDGVWLTVAGPRLYRPIIGELLAPRVDIPSAIAFYLLYVTGIVILAVTPALERGGAPKALFLGAVLGLVAYGAYDLTNQATMKVWDLRITLADMGWGAFMTAAAAATAATVAARFN